jgi:hypothetical protein
MAMKKVADTNGGGNFAPSAYLKEDGAMVEGILLSVRQVKTQYGDKPVYTLKLKDYSCKFAQGETFVEPSENTDVDFFAPTRLARQLEKVKFGKLVRISYAGTKKIGKGNPAHVYDVLCEE